jgi:hypothetical protein
MFWSPEPRTVDPRVAAFLAVEREYLARPWGPQRALIAGLVAASLASFCAAFWLRSMGLGVLVLHGMWSAKVGWSLVEGRETGRVILRPALVGLVGCDAVLLGARALLRRRRHAI